MFGFGKKKELKLDKNLSAVFSGEIISLEKVKDPMFSEKMLGEGFAIEPTDGKIFAPVSGKVTLVKDHALGFERADKLEVLLHIGIESVSLGEKPFTYKVKVGDIVEAGEEIGTVDFSQLEEANILKTAMIIFTNTEEKLADFEVSYGECQAGQTVGLVNTK
ncbi:MAG: PTS glucose transporter subunit IIA [Lactovum sp.]